jgi:hypothetical protein
MSYDEMMKAIKEGKYPPLNDGTAEYNGVRGGKPVDAAPQSLGESLGAASPALSLGGALGPSAPVVPEAEQAPGEPGLPPEAEGMDMEGFTANPAISDAMGQQDLPQAPWDQQVPLDDASVYDWPTIVQDMKERGIDPIILREVEASRALDEERDRKRPVAPQ